MTNDNFADAIAIPSIPYTSPEVDNTGFTVEDGEPAEFYFSAAQPGNDRSAWWYFDCPGDGFLYADTHQSHYLTTEFKPDTTLCVWTGTALDNLVLVGKSDDANGLTTSKHNFAATAGTRYWFQVAMTFTVEFDPDAYYVLNLEGDLTTATYPAPALRQWPRSDGLGLSSARRAWPPPRSIQRSLRPGPGAHL